VGQVVDILLGKTTAKVLQHGHDSLTVFGVGSDLGNAEWHGVARQLLAQGLLAVESDHGTLVLTEASADVLRGQREVPLRRDTLRAAPRVKTATAAKAQQVIDMPAEAAPVFERLRAWRSAAAKEQGVPAYVIFHDATLREIATLAPSSLAELSKVNGVGENKLAKYGEQVLETLGMS
jgi:ATP-dependent DNA helicase RecQ